MLQPPLDSKRPELLRFAHKNSAGGELFAHWCYPLVDPRWVRVSEATHMRPEDPVLGMVFDGAAWAVPWWIMKNHHMANLVLNGRPVYLSFCEMCSSAAAFDPVIDGRRLNFRLEGVCNGTNMATDYETGSLWPGPTGEAVAGPLKGRAMERLPLVQCTWQEWVELHPDTLVPDGEGESREGHGEGFSPGSPLVQREMGATLQHIDRRLPHYELVLGVLAGGHSRCYPLRELNRIGGRVLNDTLGGQEIAVFWRPESWMACAFSRHVDGRSLTFRTEGSVVVDEQTGTRWEISGVAAAGPLQGRQLRYVHSGVEEFLIWAAFHPETEIYGSVHSAPPAQPPGHVGSIDTVPAPISQAIERGWWQRGMSLLDIGCGDGMLAAWLAETGLEVLGVDRAPECVEQARRTFRGVVRLKFEIADFSLPVSFPRQFDALIDHGYLARLKPVERQVYVSNAAAAAKAGARFMILAPVPLEQLKQRAQDVARLFAPSFSLIKALPTALPHSGDWVRGAAFLLVRG